MTRLTAILFLVVPLVLCRCNAAGSAYSNNSGASPLSGNYTGTYNSTNFTLELNANGTYSLEWVGVGTNGTESGKYSTDSVSEMSFSGSRLQSDGTSEDENYTCTLMNDSPQLTLDCPISTGSYSVVYTKGS